MLKIIHIDYPAVVISTLAGVLFGLLWYSPLLFRKVLISDLAKNERDLTRLVIPLIFTVFGMFIFAIILDVFMFFAGFVGMDTFYGATVLSIIFSIGIIALNMLSDYMISGTQMKSFYVHASFRIILTIIMAWTLVFWQWIFPQIEKVFLDIFS